MQPIHRTHTGEIITGARLQAALDRVAQDWEELAHAIRKEDAYAPHVTDAQKEANLQGMLQSAAAIRTGSNRSFTIWQRVNTVLTGECVALLPVTDTNQPKA